MKKRKRKLVFINKYELGAAEMLFEQEAEKGWMFSGCKGMFFQFEKCTPAELKFQVDTIGTKTDIDRSEYIEYCKESGWNYICSDEKYSFFYSEAANSTPIQTDQVQKFKQITRNFLPGLIGMGCTPFIMLMVIIPMCLDMFSPKSYSNYSFSIANPMNSGFLVISILFMIATMLQLIRFVGFWIKNNRRTGNGLEIEYHSLKSIKIFTLINLVLWIMMGATIIYMMLNSMFMVWMIALLTVLCFGTVLIKKILRIKKLDQNQKVYVGILIPFALLVLLVFIIIFSVFRKDQKVSVNGQTISIYSEDAIDITLKDLGMDMPEKTDYEERIHDKSASLFGKKETFSDLFYQGTTSTGYEIDIFSSSLNQVLSRYNSLVVKDEDYSFTQLKHTEGTWRSQTVYEGTKGSETMYVVMEQGKTFVITGNLSREQAAKLSAYYAK